MKGKTAIDARSGKRHGSSAPPSAPLFDKSRLLTFRPAFDIDFVERLLGRSGNRKLPRATQVRLDEMRESLTDLIEPRVMYAVRRISECDDATVRLDCGTVLRSRKMAHALNEAESVVCFLATIGSGVDRRISRLMDENHLANGYVADALGSGAVEELTDQFQTEINRELKPWNRAVGLRFSPGYCDWPVTEQQKLFRILNGHTIGVQLDETSLMKPRKSFPGSLVSINGPGPRSSMTTRAGVAAKKTAWPGAPKA